MSSQSRHLVTAALMLLLTALALFLVGKYAKYYGYIIAASLLTAVLVLRYVEGTEQPSFRACTAIFLLGAAWFALMGTLALVAQ